MSTGYSARQDDRLSDDTNGYQRAFSETLAARVDHFIRGAPRSPLTRADRHTPDESAWRDVKSTTAALILFAFIVGMAYVCWILAAPYLTGITTAVALSIAFHQTDDERTKRQEEDVRRLENFAAVVREWAPRMPLCDFFSNSFVVFIVAGRYTTFWGLEKIVFGVKKKYWGGSKFSGMKHAPALAWFVVAPLCLWSLGGYMAIEASVAACGLLQLASAFISRKVLVTHGISFLNVFHALLLCWCLSYNLWTEVGSNLQSDLESTVAAIQQSGIELPRDIADQAIKYAVSYVTNTSLHAFGPVMVNATATLRRLAPTSVTQAFIDPIFGHALATAAAGATGGVAVAPGVAPPDSIVDPYELFVAMWHQEEIVKPVWSVVSTVATVVVNLGVLLAAWGYEVVLCLLLLSHLLHQQRTLLYSVLDKLTSPVFENSRFAEKEEKQITRALQNLFLCFFHKMAYHFFVIFVLFTLNNVQYPTVTGAVAAAIALIPIGLPPFLSPCAVTVVLAILRQNYTRAGVIGGVAFVFYVMGDTFVMEHDQLSAFETTTAVVLGSTVFGLKGIIIGPILLVVMRVLWRSSEFVEVSDTHVGDAARAGTPPSALVASSGPRKAREGGDSGSIATVAAGKRTRRPVKEKGA